MLRRQCHRRAGFSLVEVLVALFIVSAGLIALLSLFPLGAVQMGHAMRADRSAQCAMFADGKIRQDFVLNEYALDRWNVLYYTSGMTTSGTHPTVPDGVPSYPVLLDPIGVSSYSAPRVGWVAGQVNGVSRTYARSERRTGWTGASVIEVNLWGLQESLRYCTLADDMEFAPDGTPADRDGAAVAASGQPIFRHGRYTWAALLQRSGAAGSGTGLKVLVFDRRPAGVDSLDAERTFAVAVNVGDTIIDLPAAIDTVPLRVGGWLMDGTVIDPTPANQFTNPNAGTGIRNGNCYRVRSIADVGGTVTRVELETPIARPTGSPNTTAYAARFYVFADLIDVYDRPNLVPSGYQKQTP